VKSSSEELELSGKADADLKGVIARIADLGLIGAARYKKDKSEGVLQKDLTPLLSQSGKCKEAISNKLIDKLIFSSQADSPTQMPHTDHPKQSDALAQIRDAMARVDSTLGGDKISSVGDFEYSNGYQQDANHYVVVVTYQRIFKVGLQDIANASIDKNPNPDNLGGMIATGVFGWMYGQSAAGDWFDEERSYGFLRTENGWVILQLVGDPSVLASYIKPKPPTAEARPPSAPNAVMNRDYPWSAKCFVPKGTRVMDLGRAKALPEYESVAIDPGVCHLDLGPANVGIIPSDALDPVANP
jgi:hypothetical protein